MKTILMTTALLSPLGLPAAEADMNIGTCFAYMIQNRHGDGARMVARMTTDLEAAQHYVVAGLSKKVDTAVGVAACTKLKIDMRWYRPIPIITTQKEENEPRR